MSMRASDPTATGGEQTRTAAWFDDLVTDRSRERAAALNQTVLTAVVIVLSVVLLASRFPGDVALFFAGASIVFLLTGVTVLVPWNRIPTWCLAIVPLLDILAITLMRVATPGAGTGIMWVLPVLWLAAGFGLAGLLLGVAASVAAYLGTTIIDERQSIAFAIFLLPVVLVVVGTAAFVTARRARAQRTLLARQADLLLLALERARRHEQTLTEVLDAVDIGVVRLDRDGSTILANDAHMRMLASIDPTTPMYAGDAGAPLEADARPLARARGGAAFEEERFTIGEPGPEARVLVVSSRRVTDAAGADAGAVVICREPERGQGRTAASAVQAVDLVALVGAATAAAAPGASRRGIQLAERTSRAVALAAPGSVRRAIDALLRVAVQRSPEGGEVTVVTAARGPRVVILVQDGGPGLTAEEAAALFGPRPPASAQAAGIDLAACRDDVRRDGGDIAVTSGPASGATFSVTLPAAEATG